jgi:CMP-N-acetylneuraminic acid synthetase
VKKVLSVVCARAGSKGVKNKCIRKIGKKMVIEYAIEYSLSLGENVRTVVSTDITSVIDFCEQRNIEFIERESKFCADESRIDAALADAIEKKGREYDYCSLVYGNIPTRYIDMFYQSLNYLEMHMNYDMAISMQNVEKNHPDWMYDFNEEILPRKKEVHYRRQMLPQKMQSDGHTFIFRIKKFLDNYKGLSDYNKDYALSVYGEKIKPVINDNIIIDIDTRNDFLLAEAILK